jgi:ATP-dependent helicase HepA
VGLVQQRFTPGQRWLSEAEPDLGLGLVEAVDGRHVRLHFAGSDQHRNYAAHNAPLTRVRFEPDDRIQDRAGRDYTVRSVEERHGLLFYLCTDDAGVEDVLPEQALSDRLRLNRPQDRLLACRIDSDIWFSLRYLSWLEGAKLWRSPVFGLQGPRIDLIPHQLYIAAEVASRPSVRVLLADEVGLGKTIEAGLILHRLILTERVQRVLVVVPDALVNQWLVEMLRRFNLSFSVFDQERFEASDSDSPFQSEQRVLCSLSFLTLQPQVARAVLDGEWDLLIVDEAHHLTWSEQETGLAYQLVEALADQTANVLLLTATPEQLGRAGHFGRLRLLDPQRFHSYRDFVAEEAAYAPVATVAGKLLEGDTLNADDRRLLGELVDEETEMAPAQLIARLIDRHGTGRILFRNTRQAIKGFPRRHLTTYPLPCPERYRTLAAEPQPEQAFGGGWTDVDPRVDWLRRLLQTLVPAKVLVICALADTAIALRDHLLNRCAIHAAMFHERMEIVARDRAAAFFADPDEGSQVLICSEIGSEGRNFQFAHHLVLFDLPLEPDLLEQRIGRLDRVGQRETIELHVPYLLGSAGEGLMRWYRDGLGSFEASCPAASAVNDALGERLLEALANPDQIGELVEQAATLTAEVNDRLEAGRDRLLELHSFDAAQAAELVELVRGAGDTGLLREFMSRYWDAFGVEYEAGSERSLVLRPGSHMLHDHYPGLGAEGATVTFDRADALAHEDRLFLSWEHPMVRGSMEMLTSGELGAAAVTVCSDPGYRTGTVFLEALFITECPVPRGLEVQRYLPSTCLRYLLDANGEDKADILPHEALSGLCLTQNRKLADTVIKSQGDRLKLLIAHAEQLAEQAAADIAADAVRTMQAELEAEQDRLTALAKVNPNVRQDEIEQLSVRRELIALHLQQTQVRLDAVRVIVMR